MNSDTPADPKAGPDYNPDLARVTLRDVFAAVALAGYCTREGQWALPMNVSESEALAHWSYEQADAMLAERSR